MRILVCITLVCAITGAFCLYEDQAGTLNWYNQYVGNVLGADFHTSRPRVFVGTENNAVASLSLRDGSIVWRKVYAEGDDIQSVQLLERSSTIVTLSSNGRLLRSIDATDGTLRVEKVLFDSHIKSQSMSQLLTIDTKDGFGMAVAAAAGKIHAYDVKQGSQLWQQSLKVQDAMHDLHLVLSSANTLTTISIGPQGATIQELNIEDGSSVSESTVSCDVSLSAVSASVAGASVALSADKSSLCVMDHAAKTCSCQAVTSLTSSRSLGASPSIKALAGSFVLQASQGSKGAVVLSVRSGELSTIAQHASAVAVSAVLAADRTKLYAVVEQSSAGTKIRVFDASSHTQVAEETVSSGLPTAHVSNVFLGLFKRKDSTYGYRYLISFQDHSVALVQQSTVVWVREDALAGSTSTLWTDLPAVPKQMAGVDDTVDFNMRMRAQLLGFKVQFKLSTEEEEQELQKLRVSLSSRSLPTRDANGLRKLVLVLTRAGKVFALHSGTGKIMWSAFFPTSSPSTARLLPWTSFHDVSHAPHVALLLGSSQRQVVVVLDAHTGKTVETIELKDDADKIVALQTRMHDGTAEQSIYLVTSSQSPSTAYLLPDTPQSRAHFSSQYRSTFLWDVDQQSGVVVGRGFDKEGAEKVVGAGLKLAELWRLQLQDAVMAVAARDASEPLHSAVKVLGDRSMMYKYVNPNMFFIATGIPEGTPLSGSGADSSSPLTVYILDSVTGHVLHSQVHSGGRGPVHALFTENAVVYQYFDANAARFTTTVIELYDATPRSFNIVNAVMGTSSVTVMSSFDQPTVHALSQSYFSRMPARFITTTRTAKGITSKQLLFGTTNDQVYALDRRFVDPRRPLKKKLNAQEIEERLIPYQDMLPVMPPMFSTYNNQVAQLRGVSVSPSALESTCHLVAYGLDMFYTRLSPAGLFDSLHDDFSYALLVVALTALAIGASMVAYFTGQAALKKAWA